MATFLPADAHDVKSAGFYSLLGLDELCLDPAAVSEDEIMSAVVALIEGRHAVAAALRVRRAELAADSKDFCEAVAVPVAPYRSGRLAPLHSGNGSVHTKDARSVSRK